MLTVPDLVAALDLELVAGQQALGSPIRWVHVSELEDPTPWLSGGELLLTTGMQLTDETAQRDYVRRLVDHQLAGLGIGTGFSWDRLPEAAIDEARTHDFPLFEVPYAMPFIAITEQAFATLVDEQYDVLRRAVAVHRRVERLVLDGRGLDEVVRTLANALGASLFVFAGDGRILASRAFRRSLSAAALDAVRAEVIRASAASSAAAFVPAHAEFAGHGLALPVPGDADQSAAAWLVAVTDGGLAAFEHFIAQHAVMALALALMRERIVRDTERRLAGDVLGGALSGALDPAELRARLIPFGIVDRAAVLVFDLADPALRVASLEATLDRAVVAVVPTSRRDLLCAVVDPAGRDLAALAREARDALAVSSGPVRVAHSGVAPIEALRRTFHEARCALELGALENGSAPQVVSADDLGSYRLLLSLQDDDGLRLYCDKVLGPIELSPTGNGSDLLRSLEVFLEHNGSWEAAARALYCHRHTLRYRIGRVEQLTGRRLDSAEHRIEFWLALRGRELLA
jgi:purine catabolism regulator